MQIPVLMRFDYVAELQLHTLLQVASPDLGLQGLESCHSRFSNVPSD